MTPETVVRDEWHLCRYVDESPYAHAGKCYVSMSLFSKIGVPPGTPCLVRRHVDQDTLFVCRLWTLPVACREDCGTFHSQVKISASACGHEEADLATYVSEPGHPRADQISIRPLPLNASPRRVSHMTITLTPHKKMGIKRRAYAEAQTKNSLRRRFVCVGCSVSTDFSMNVHVTEVAATSGRGSRGRGRLAMVTSSTIIQFVWDDSGGDGDGPQAISKPADSEDQSQAETEGMKEEEEKERDPAEEFAAVRMLIDMVRLPLRQPVLFQSLGISPPRGRRLRFLRLSCASSLSSLYSLSIYLSSSLSLSLYVSIYLSVCLYSSLLTTYCSF